MRKEIRRKEKIFLFGKTRYIAKVTVKIPCAIGEKKFFIETFVVEGKIPWLIGKDTLGRMGAVIDLGRMEMWVKKFKKGLKIRCDENGHLKLKLCEMKRQVWMAKSSEEKLEKRMVEKIIKLHKQFGHPGQERLWRTIKDSEFISECNDQEKISIKDKVKEISEKCEICQKYKKTPSRPVVGLGLGETFNACVSMDIGMMKDGRLLLMIVDTVTKFSQGAWLKSKKPEEVMEGFLSKWLGVFGAPESILTDNGGEFQNDDILRMCERFGIKMMATSSESPWSNGICEKAVGATKEIVSKIREDTGANWEVCLMWALNARNSLCNRNGYTAYQL